MTQLIDVTHCHLTPYVLRMLRKHRIETVTQLLGATDRTLSKAANLCSVAVAEIRQHLLESYGPTVYDGLTLKDSAIIRTFLLQTGIKG